MRYVSKLFFILLTIKMKIMVLNHNIKKKQAKYDGNGRMLM